MPLLLRSLALLLVLLAAWPQAPAHATQAAPIRIQLGETSPSGDCR